LSSFKIDAYSHVAPLKYKEALERVSPKGAQEISGSPPLYDLDHRFRLMDRYQGLVQVLTPTSPAIEEVADTEKAVELARLANDETAELVVKYPDRFVAAIATLPMNDIDAALREAERAIEELDCRGILIYSNVKGKPLDSPELLPLYEKMAGYDLPIYIHPHLPSYFPDYGTAGEVAFKFAMSSIFGRPYETTAAMTRLIFGGILEKHPNLKIVTHHCGAMVPYFAERITMHYGRYEAGTDRHPERTRNLKKHPTEYYRMFYNDTAIHGNTPALMCAYAFFGADRLLFGADMPRGDPQFGERSYRQTIDAIEQMDISDSDKKKIFADNTRRLLRLNQLKI
jgi:predicted TIM-barrel fold metal-dependent hydrolase